MSEEIKIDLELDEPDYKPTLYTINKCYDVAKSGRYDGVVGEEQARMVLFTNFVLAERPVILRGNRGSGKTNLMEITSLFCRNPTTIANTSEKAHQYMRDMNDRSHVFIPEFNKVTDGVIEMLKDFGEGASHFYSRTIPGLNEIETIELKPKPFVTSIADENKNVNNLGEELLSRLTVVRTDSSIDQNLRVIEEKFKRHQNPFYEKSVDSEQVYNAVSYVKGLPSINNYKFIYPAGTAMMKAIPPIFTDSRRDTDKYLYNTYGITMFHYWDRMSMEVDDNTYLFVTPVDMWLNHRIYQQVLIESALKCGPIENAILDIVREEGGERRQSEFGDTVKGLTSGEIHTELQKRSYHSTVDAVKKYCDSLLNTGYLTRNEEVRPYRYEINPNLERNYTVDLNWDEIVKACISFMQENFPDVADEYIAKHCVGKKLEVQDPFTGETVLITDIEEPEPELDVQIEIDDEPDVDFDWDDGVLDSVDNAEDSLRAVFADGGEHTLADLSKDVSIGMDELETTVNYLVTVGDVYEVRSGVYQRLE